MSGHINEKLRRAHLVEATHENNDQRRARIRRFFPGLDPDQTIAQLDEAAANWDHNRYRSEQIYAELIKQDKEART